jgi:hypothetical protein
MRHVPQKRRLTFHGLHGVIAQKKELFMFQYFEVIKLIITQTYVKKLFFISKQTLCVLTVRSLQKIYLKQKVYKMWKNQLIRSNFLKFYMGINIDLTVFVGIQTFTVVAGLLDIYEASSSSNLFYKLALQTPMLCVHSPHKVSPGQSKAKCNFML